MNSLFVRCFFLRPASKTNPNAPPVRDNDSLAARLACELSSDLLLMVSDVDGVYTEPPGSPGARLITHYEVEDHIDLTSNRLGEPVSFGSASKVGTGGMQNKVASALWAVRQVISDQRTALTTIIKMLMLLILFCWAPLVIQSYT